MKKLFRISVLIMALITCFSAFGCNQEEPPKDVIIDNGIEYAILSETEVEVSALKKDTTIITIPETVGAYTVVGVGELAFNYKKLITKVTLPQTVTYINSSAFRNCEKLATINLGAVQVFGANCFNGCKVLRPIDLTSATTIGASAFQGCLKLTMATIPESVTVIGASAFAGCKILSTVQFNGIIERACTNAFSGCGLLSTINIGNIKYFEEGVFTACVALKDINLVSAEYISNMVFQSCTGLTEVTIGANCIYVNKNAFNKCTNVEKVYFADRTGWINVGTCARCAITEWAGTVKAEDLANPENNVSRLVAGDWNHNVYMCKDEWKNVNRPNGWNKNKGEYCGGCKQGK